MDDAPGKGLSLMAGIMLTITIITVAVIIVAIVINYTKTAQDDISGMTDTLSQTKYSAYDNSTVSGSQVLNAVRQYNNQDGFGVVVKTGKGTSTNYGYTFNETTGDITSTTNNVNLSPAQDQANTNYVNPSGRFTSKLVSDSNGVVRGIVFSQK